MPMNTYIHNTDEEDDDNNDTHSIIDDEYIHNNDNSNKKEKTKASEKGIKKGHNSDQLIAKVTARGLIMNCANCIRLQVSIVCRICGYILLLRILLFCV